MEIGVWVLETEKRLGLTFGLGLMEIWFRNLGGGGVWG